MNPKDEELLKHVLEFKAEILQGLETVDSADIAQKVHLELIRDAIVLFIEEGIKTDNHAMIAEGASYINELLNVNKYGLRGHRIPGLRYI